MIYPKLEVAHMNIAQKECFDLVCDLVGGKHHIDGVIRRLSSDGISVTMRHFNLATWDGNALTRLVFMAHDRAIRVSIKASSSQIIKLELFKRIPMTPEIASISMYHPSLNQAIARYRESYPLENK